MNKKQLDKQWNIVLIISDQWSTRIVDGSGNYDNGICTPGIDRLATDGIRFEQSYASFPLCCPARASMFTGLMPHKHRIIDNEENYKDKYGAYPTRKDLLTMGRAFKNAGYRTAFFGKEHGGDYGWDGIGEFGSMKYSAGGMLAEGSAFDQIFTRDAINFIRSDHDRPFYMVLSLINPHDICKVLGGKVKGATFADAIFFCRNNDEPYLRFQPRPSLPTNHDSPFIEGMIRHRGYMYQELEAFSQDDWKRYLAAYCLLIENTDWYIELLLDALRDAGLEENTIVIFTTDHGDMMGSHHLIAKTTFYEESAKTMMIVRQPGMIIPGTVNTDALIATIDLMPTILDLCDIPVPDSLDGKSFKDQCYGEDRGHFQELYSVNRDSRMLRFGQYKYIHSEVYGQEYEILFDLWADPDETTNVFGQDGYEAVSSEARQRLDAWLQRQNLSLTFDSI
jgi:arylsulfatase A-like enzyme